MLASILASGLAVGAVYALIGVTYNTMFSTSRVMSFTAGQLGMLGGVFGSQVKLENGQTVLANESYIRESILTPQMKLVQGYGPIMPTFQGLVNEEGLASLIEYVKSLPGTNRGGEAQASAAAPPDQGAQK